MLNSQRDQPPYENETGESAGSPLDLVFKLARIARRQIVVVGVITILGTAAGAVVALTTPPAYVAEASILVETRKVQLFNRSPMIDESALDGAAMETQLQILRSDRTVMAVIDALRLTEDPEFVAAPEGLVGRIRQMLARRFHLGRAEERHVPASTTPAELAESAMQAFQSRLELYRLGSSYAIAIRFRASEPHRAAQIANAVADAYINGQRDMKIEEATGASSWLQQRLRQLQEQSVAADQAVLDFKVKNKIVTAKGQLLDDQELGDLNAQVVAARVRTSEARARLDRIDAVISTNAADPANVATVTDALNNPVITKLRSQSLDLASRLNDWSVRFGADHLAVVDLRRQLQELRLSALNELKRVAETYKSEYEIARQGQDIIEKQLAASVADTQVADQAQAPLRELESAAQTYHSLYDNFLQRYAELAHQQSFPMSDATLIARAPVPTVKSQPKTRLILCFAAFASALMGCGVGVLRDLLDRVFRTAEQVETILQADCLAMVPKVEPGNPKRASRMQPRIIQAGGTRTIMRIPDVMWSAVDRPHSRFADALRAVKSSIDQTLRSPCKVVGITSSQPNEGKSVTAAALALLMAEVGARVLLVDGDLRNSSLSRGLAPAADYGLPDLVLARSSFAETIWTDPVTSLSVLPGCVGIVPPHSNELLASRATRAVFDGLRADYDYVVVDLPPLVPLLDVRATSGIIDAYALVVEWGETKVHVVERALKSVRVVQDNLLGVVLSKVDIRLLKRYEAAGASYYGDDGPVSPGAPDDARSWMAELARKRTDA